MKKRLLLTLLPLAFLVAACSGANKPASSSKKSGGSSAGGDTETSEPAGDDSGAEGDESSAEGGGAGDDERAEDEPVANGYSVQIGSVYFELSAQTTDAGRKESYNIKGVAVEAGDTVSVYKDGEKLSVWAEADKANNAYPNYDERPQESQYQEFTISVSDDNADIYFHVNSDDSYAIWITPTQGEGGGESGGSGSTPEGAPATGMAIVVNGEDYYALTNEGAWSYDSSFTQYSNTSGIALEAGDVLTFYNADAEGGPATWGTMSIDPASKGSLTQGSEGLVVGQGGTYDVYIKMKFAQDNIYLGPHGA